ncbi:hypothetical protein E2C01_024802 [Portunus trituberculatus]|uniref:Uncharacterized protein n=1 Tax=Portunus trituberculatus TaxID=210409 RepID=A0A5B7EBQ2_PORTR|nr:hypothetical protein [Portunus trituberculatus]
MKRTAVASHLGRPGLFSGQARPGCSAIILNVLPRVLWWCLRKDILLRALLRGGSPPARRSSSITRSSNNTDSLISRGCAPRLTLCQALHTHTVNTKANLQPVSERGGVVVDERVGLAVVAGGVRCGLAGARTETAESRP